MPTGIWKSRARVKTKLTHNPNIKKIRKPEHYSSENSPELNSVIDNAISLTEMFTILGDMARNKKNPTKSFNAIQLILSYRLGRPAQLVINKNLADESQFREVATAFADALLELPIMESENDGTTSESTAATS